MVDLILVLSIFAVGAGAATAYAIGFLKGDVSNI
jgi:hypothetical protein